MTETTIIGPHAIRISLIRDWHGGYYWDALCTCRQWRVTMRSRLDVLARAEAHQEEKHDRTP